MSAATKSHLPVTRNQLGCNGYDSRVQQYTVQSELHCSQRASSKHAAAAVALVAVWRDGWHNQSCDLDHHQLTAPPWMLIGQSDTILTSDWG